MNASRIRIAGLLAGLAALAASLLPSAALADVPPAQVPASLQTAIKAEVESRGYEYAGLARVVNENPPLPVGKWVAFVLSIEHDIAEVTIGPVASDEIHRVNFENRNGTWVKQGAVTTPTQGSGGTATPKPPATGDGVVDDSGSDNGILFGVVGAAVVAMAGAGLATTIARRR